MTGQPSTRYEHTQKGPWSLILLAFGLPMVALAWWLWEQPLVPSFVAPLVGGSGVLLLVLSPCFHRLTVADEGDRLAIRFGPLPLFQRHIRYADLRAVETGRSTLLDGWGIHWSLQGGVVWNIWGWDCVVLRHGGTTRVGTNDAKNLAAFLRTRIAVAGDHA
jgi:hypothetical protein